MLGKVHCVSGPCGTRPSNTTLLRVAICVTLAAICSCYPTLASPQLVKNARSPSHSDKMSACASDADCNYSIRKLQFGASVHSTAQRVSLAVFDSCYPTANRVALCNEDSELNRTDLAVSIASHLAEHGIIVVAPGQRSDRQLSIYVDELGNDSSHARGLWSALFCDTGSQVIGSIRFQVFAAAGQQPGLNVLLVRDNHTAGIIRQLAVELTRTMCATRQIACSLLDSRVARGS